ncbi:MULTISPECIES: CBS domain-containing protein [Saccharothrix]|uniref:Histidine kinase n=2 Tax=Saccharothrix TaxID=2071 RepID=A0ABU0X0W9_9PSEU|nr:MULTISPECIES: CBS domain-containing protein [Saccharothrix]MBY8850418.1 CBS domain-containing protein [Saccharothrix sp. MB29]MDQ2585696.1 histidine kinase [Saccharothrix yanglingensis]MDR6598944.1 CBS domain-containing protein [Saccharothrix longispora]MDU0291128.1 CBS domain-containing protein [Saccharothrix longispora]
MRIADVLRNKGSDVATVEAGASVAELLAALAGRNVGAMVVTGPGGITGIVSERDVVRGLHDRGGALLGAPVAEIMTSEVLTCTPRDSVDSLTVLMTERRIRHVPVLDDGRLVGIVSIGDVVKSRIDQLQNDHDQLAAYIAQG